MIDREIHQQRLTDERRARAIMAQSAEAPAWDDAPADIRNICLFVAHAIRTSDEAAGMVLVPREATENMQQAGEYAWMHRNLNNPNSNPLQDCYRAMLAAATESDNG